MSGSSRQPRRMECQDIMNTRTEHAVWQEQEPEKETDEEKTLLFEIGQN